MVLVVSDEPYAISLGAPVCNSLTFLSERVEESPACLFEDDSHGDEDEDSCDGFYGFLIVSQSF